MIWHEHVSSIATAAGKKLGYLFKARKYFSPSNLLTLYKAQIRPSLKYCSHIWVAAAPTTLSILNAVQGRADKKQNTTKKQNNNENEKEKTDRRKIRMEGSRREKRTKNRKTKKGKRRTKTKGGTRTGTRMEIRTRRKTGRRTV
nr:unnamed protein product [Callosobruchus chinensis]